MNEEKPQPQPLTSQVGTAIPTTELHPLNILDNQIDPERKPKKPDVGQKPLRTYEGDIAEALARQKTSVVTMVVAEKEKETGEKSISNKPPSQAGKKFFLVIASLIFLVAGAGGGYYLYLKSPLATPPLPEAIIKVPSVIPADIQKSLKIASLQKSVVEPAFANQFRNGKEAEGKITEFIPVLSATSTVKITSSQFINALTFDMTDTLKRSFTDRWMVGVYPTEEGNIPFIIFTTDFFQNAFAGMLRWEASMPEELADLFDYREKANRVIEEEITLATTTATTTLAMGTSTAPVATSTIAATSTRPSTLTSFYNIQGNFTDRVVMNRDLRQFVSRSGENLFFYSFIDKNTLVISTDDRIIGILLDRIEKQTYIR